LRGWIGESRDGIIEGVETVGYSVMYVAINVGISKESVNNLSAAAHNLINANTQQNNLGNSTNKELKTKFYLKINDFHSYISFLLLISFIEVYFTSNN